MAELNFKITGENEQLKQVISDTETRIKGLNDAAIKSGQGVDKMIDGMVGQIKKLAAAYASFEGAKAFVNKMIEVRGQFQLLEVSFKTMLGSADKANTLMSQLAKTAAITPFNMSDVANGAKQLLAYGESADKVNDDLIRLGNIAAGLSIPLNDLTWLYGTTMTQGRMYTQDLNQFLGRGIPMMDELAKQFGVSKDQVKGLVEEGKVGFPQVQKAIEDLTNQGGRFYNLMEEQSKTILGQKSNIEDAFEMMLNDIGKQSEGIVNDVLSGVSMMIEHYKEIGSVLQDLIVIYGAYKAAVMTMSAWNTASANITSINSIMAEGQVLKTVETSAIQATLAKKGLTAGTVEYYTALKSELLAEQASIDKSLAAAQADTTAARQKAIAATEASIASRQKVIDARAELVAAKAGVNTDRIAAAQTALNTAIDERSAAAKARKAAMANAANAAARSGALAERSAAISTALDTAGTNANTAAKSFNITATNLLKASVAKLQAVLAANVWTLVAVGIAAVTYGIYKLITADDAATAATKEFNAEQDAMNKKMEDTKQQAESLISKMQDSTAATGDRRLAYIQLMKIYPELLSKYKNENELLANTANLSRDIANINLNRIIQENTKKLQEYQRELANARRQIETISTANYATPGAAAVTPKSMISEYETRMQTKIRLAQQAIDKANNDKVIQNLEDVSTKEIQHTIKSLTNYRNNVRKGFNAFVSKNGLFRGTILNSDANIYIDTLQSELERRGVGTKKRTKSASQMTKSEIEYEKQKAQEELDGLKEIDAKGKKGAALRKKIAKYDKQLEPYSSSKSESSANKVKTAREKAERDAERAREQADKLEKSYNDAYNSLAESVNSMSQKASDSILSTSIELMTNSNEKEIAQLKKDEEDKRQAILQEADKTAELLAKVDYAQWKRSNPKGTWKQYAAQGEKQRYDAWKQVNPSGTEEQYKAQNKNAFGTKEYWQDVLTNKNINLDTITKNKNLQGLILSSRMNIDTMLSNNEAISNKKLDDLRKQAVISMNEYLSEYGSYQEKRLAITELYNDKIAKAVNEGEKRTLQAQLDDKLKDLDFNEFKKSINWEDIFGNLDVFNYSTLERLRKQLQEYINKAADSIKPTDMKALTDALNNIDIAGIDKNPFKSYGKALNEFQAASKNVRDVQKDLDTIMSGGDVVVGIYTDSMGKLQTKTLSQEDAEKKLADAQVRRAKAQELLQKSGSGIMDGFQRIGESIKSGLSKVGDTELSSTIGEWMDYAKSIQEAASIIKSAFKTLKDSGGKDFSGFNWKNMTSIITSLMNVTFGLIGMESEAEKRHQEALDKLYDEKISMQREYNLLLLQQNQLYKEGTTIFGTDDYAKAINSVKVMTDAQKDLNNAMSDVSGNNFYADYMDVISQRTKLGDLIEKYDMKGYSNKASSLDMDNTWNNLDLQNQYKGLAGVMIKTGHKKTGLFGWGKGKDLYSSILSIYPDLIKANGEFDTSLAETILKTRELDDTSRNTLQNIIDLSKQADESWKSVTDWLTNIFGQLGSDITSILKDAFINGTDAAQQMCNSISSMLETLAQQMVYSFAFQTLFSDAQKQIEQIMKDTTKDEKTKFTEFTDVFGKLSDQLIAATPEAEKMMAQLKQIADAKGFDLFSNNSSSASTNNTVKADVTQSQADFIGAQLMGANASLNGMNVKITSLITINSNGFNQIVSLQRSANDYLADIVKFTKDTNLVVRENVPLIKQYTSRI